MTSQVPPVKLEAQFQNDMSQLLTSGAFKQGSLRIYRDTLELITNANAQAQGWAAQMVIPLAEIVEVQFTPGGFASGGHLTVCCQKDNFRFTLNFSLSQSTQASQVVAVLEQARSALRNPVLMTAKGVNGQLELLADRVRIKRKGGMAVLTQGLKGDKEIQLSSISSIQFRAPGALTNGYIQFAFFGGQEAKGALFQATQDENSIMFSSPQSGAFVQIKEAIESQKAKLLIPPLAPAPTPVSAAISPVEELEKWASLRDKGIVTEDEFQAKKKQLLGL